MCFFKGLTAVLSLMPQSWIKTCYSAENRCSSPNALPLSPRVEQLWLLTLCHGFISLLQYRTIWVFRGDAADVYRTDGLTFSRLPVGFTEGSCCLQVYALSRTEEEKQNSWGKVMEKHLRVITPCCAVRCLKTENKIEMLLFAAIEAVDQYNDCEMIFMFVFLT